MQIQHKINPEQVKEIKKNTLQKRYTEPDFVSWGNSSLEGWHIDHIRPCASFDLTDPEQQKQCFHYTNLQPLWAEDNLRKSDKWEEDDETESKAM